MNLAATLGRALAISPAELLRRVSLLGRYRARRIWERWRDARHTTCLASAPIDGVPGRLLALPATERLHAVADVVRQTAALCLDHRFDLLGSGWVQVRYGSPCAGLAGHRYPPGEPVCADAAGEWLAGHINRPNLAAAQAAWKLLARPERPGGQRGAYQPIDWQLDFKSGYRWRADTPSSAIRFGGIAGVDIKLPWELARMQHLPQLAWAYVLARDGAAGFAAAERYAEEFEDEVVDFIAANPPRFGVNWVSAMDVAIRAANWLVAHDLLRAAGRSFGEDFQRRFLTSVVEHGRHIRGHMDRDRAMRANHYLADIAGLAIVAAYLPWSRESGDWLLFATRKLIEEVARQFTADGANFEASTAYHRLSAEMVLYATLVILALPQDKASRLAGRLPEPPFPDWYLRRLAGAADFTAALTRPDGRIVQIGDNDSGRFLKLWPAYAGSDGGGLPKEDPSDHRHLVAAIRALRGESPSELGSDAGVEAETVAATVRAAPTLGRTLPADPAAGTAGIPAPFQAFADFGVYVYRVDEMMLVVRCGPVGQNGNGGHAHNDQLSFELAVAGTPVIVDPGTCVYTPLPEQRNRFRSTAMHNTLSLPDWEQNTWLAGPAGLFWLQDKGRSRVIAVDPTHIVAEICRGTVTHRRTLRMTAGEVEGQDECNGAQAKAVHFHLAPGISAAPAGQPGTVLLSWSTGQLRLEAGQGTWDISPSHYSAAYGEQVETCQCILRSPSPVIPWRLVL